MTKELENEVATLTMKANEAYNAGNLKAFKEITSQLNRARKQLGMKYWKEKVDVRSQLYRSHF